MEGFLRGRLEPAAGGTEQTSHCNKLQIGLSVKWRKNINVQLLSNCKALTPGPRAYGTLGFTGEYHSRFYILRHCFSRSVLGTPRWSKIYPGCLKSILRIWAPIVLVNFNVNTPSLRNKNLHQAYHLGTHKIIWDPDPKFVNH